MRSSEFDLQSPSLLLKSGEREGGKWIMEVEMGYGNPGYLSLLSPGLYIGFGRRSDEIWKEIRESGRKSAESGVYWYCYGS